MRHRYAAGASFASRGSLFAASAGPALSLVARGEFEA
jgi:hypothetical protein